MKPRTVTISIEVQTDVPLNEIGYKDNLQKALSLKWPHNRIAVKQSEAQVSQPVKEKNK